jgi:hypothetical protein
VPAEGNSVETALSEIAIKVAAKIVLVIPTIPNPKNYSKKRYVKLTIKLGKSIGEERIMIKSNRLIYYRWHM